MTYATKCLSCDQPVLEGDPVLALGRLGHERIDLDGAVVCRRETCGRVLNLDG